MISDAALAAEECRNSVGIPLDEPIADILTLAERDLGYNVYVIDLPGGGVEGAHLLDDGQHFVFLAAIKGNGQRWHPLRQRFTLAHEIGHGYLGHGSIIDESVDGADGSVGEERAADEFASSLLMPSDAIEAWLQGRKARSIDNLDAFCAFAGHFGVSSPAAWRRLRDESQFSNDHVQKSLADIVFSPEGASDARKQRGNFVFRDSLQRLYKDHGFHLAAAFHTEVDRLMELGLVSHVKAGDLLDGRAK